MQKEALYHTKSPEKIIKVLKSDSSGLSKQEAFSRLKSHGLNKIPEKKQISPLFIIIKQFHSLFIYILVLAAIISFIFDRFIDVYVIVAVIIINASIGFFQEYKAEKAIEALKKMIVQNAKVYRSSQLLQIPAKNLVPGDIILLEQGDRIPADARLIEVKNLRTVEASLTGESFPEYKYLDILPQQTPLADRKNMVYLGTFIATGTAKAIVVSTGARTAIGSLASQIEQIKSTKSHFQGKTDSLALTMAVIAIIGASLVFLTGYFIRRFEFKEIFLFTLASLVSGIPEGLPAVLAIVLAIGAFRMARKKALIRKLSATETLGVVNTIITDKTGTLTQNTMTIEKVLLPSESPISITGHGWFTRGEFQQKSKTISPLEKVNLRKLLHIASICNKSSIIKKEGDHDEYKIIGDPTEAALIVLAEKAEIKKSILLEKENLIDDIPFNPESKYRASLISLTEEKAQKQIYVVGAPEEILSLSSKVLKKDKITSLSTSDNKKILSDINTLTKNAMRVLALAYSPVLDETKKLRESDVKDLVFVGLVAMKDPPRPGVLEAIQKTHKAGIKVVMATGDHKNTALAIAKEIGFKRTKTLTQTELVRLEKTSKIKFQKAILETDIFARLTPGMKLKIASVLQQQGNIIAMTGDGVNDAPALKKADVGISMGVIGTDVARASSDIVLADDNFASIVSAIEEGRIVFTNTRQTASFLVVTNFAEHATIVATMLIGMPLPLLPTQILWLNLVTDTGPALGLAAEPDYNHSINEPPRSSKENFLNRSIIPILILMTIVMAIVTILTFKYFLPEGIDKARTAAFAVMTFTQLFNTYNMRSMKKSIFKIGIFSNKYVNIALIVSILTGLLALYLPFFQRIFQFTSLSILELLAIIALSSLVLWSGEIYKLIKK
tara:strand:+ start:4805 stop:7498 length:2694 start_codon:yes stop_codon:yes gene_type:complete